MALCYRRHRFPPEIIQHAIWLYLRFALSYRDVEDIEYGYAKLTKADFALLQNKAGQFVLADTKSGQATLATATLDSRLRGWIEDPAAADAYPPSPGFFFTKSRIPRRRSGCANWSTTASPPANRSKYGLHPVAREHNRENQDRVGANPIDDSNVAYGPSPR